MLEHEETLKNAILAAFPALAPGLTVQRARRLWLEVPREDFLAVLDFLTESLGVVNLCTITGLDEGDRFGALYHLARQDGVVLNVKVPIPKEDPRIRSVTGRYPGAVFYERELVDLLGIVVEELPVGPRYPLRDDWPSGSFPLRKDWNAELPAGDAAGTKEP
jgi:Ni,Fe-hydrogenase III component G